MSVDREEKSAQRRPAGRPEISRSSRYVQVVQVDGQGSGREGEGVMQEGQDIRSPALGRALEWMILAAQWFAARVLPRHLP